MRAGGIRATWTGGLRLLLILTLLVAAFIRPPGTMLGHDGERLTYVICTGDQIRTITVSAETGQEVLGNSGPECDFFAAQIAALLADTGSGPVIRSGVILAASQFQGDLFARQPARLRNAARAPPLETGLS